jgi:hypothetical protein
MALQSLQLHFELPQFLHCPVQVVLPHLGKYIEGGTWGFVSSRTRILAGMTLTILPALLQQHRGPPLSSHLPIHSATSPCLPSALFTDQFRLGVVQGPSSLNTVLWDIDMARTAPLRPAIVYANNQESKSVRSERQQAWESL